MISHDDTPDEKYWVEMGEDRRIHPYAIFQRMNKSYAEVVHSIHQKRHVFIIGGEYRVCVKVAELDEYGYELQPEERVSEAEREAIALKQTARTNGEDVSVEEVRELVASGTPEQVEHALEALRYAAEADPDVSEEDVDRLREIRREHPATES